MEFITVENKKYDIIYADPPWQYRVWTKRSNGTAASHYRTQPIHVLRQMRIQALAKPNSVLFLWATFPCLEQAIELGKSWGFVYKTVAFTWIKINKHNQQPFMGLGHYTRANAEIVLLFTKGKPLTRIAKNVPQVLLSQRGLHSEKPDEIRQRIVRLFGNLDRLELFARTIHPEAHQGWDVYGDEAINSITLPE